MVLAQLRGRLGRTLALLLGILVATTAFTVLTASARTSRLEVTGTVTKSFRSSYDLLIRPDGARTRQEQATGTVEPNFLGGIYGGITLDQWHQIQDVPGVQVAAPIAMVGYALPSVPIKVDLTPVLGPAQRQAFRVTTTWVTDRGSSRISEPTQYVYVTRHRLRQGADIFAATRERNGAGWATACRSDSAKPPTAFALQYDGGDCFTTRGMSGALGYPPVPPGRISTVLYWVFPMLVAAIDPVSEARLDGLDHAVTAGRYLRPTDGIGDLHRDTSVEVPALVADHTSLDDTAVVTADRLSALTGVGLPAHTAVLSGAPAQPVLHKDVTAASAYARLLAFMLGKTHSNFFEGLDGYWNIGPTSLTASAGATTSPAPVTNPAATWKSIFQFTGWVRAPADNADVQFRRIAEHESTRQGDTLRMTMPAPRAVGVFDPSKVRAFNALSKVPLGLYETPTAAPADAASRRALHGADLLPNRNLGGYLTTPPQILTTLAALPAFNNSLNFSGNTHRADPISVIRVRVAGVTGPDPVSRERVRKVAELIATRTGLNVDITVGSSPTPRQVRLQAGRFGRPALLLSENWVKKGVAVAILTALDRKSVALFSLILLVCALFVTNAAGAAVRTRRTELGVLACLGWSSGRLFAALLGEVAVVGLVAGVGGSALAVIGSRLAGQEVSFGRAIIAVPAAVALSLLAGAVPALRASRADPGAAVRPAGNDLRRGRRLRSITGLALRNVLRTPGRSALAAAALAIGTAALTIALAVAVAFRGVLVGSLLGDAVSVQIRTGDVIGIAAIVALGAAALADVLYLGIRERASDLSTLRATGWDETALHRLIGAEAALLGLVGATLGAGVGLLGARALAGSLPGDVLLLAVGVIATGMAIAVLAAAVPAALLRRLPTTELLAEE
jgi:putative ABC transport system permease protein